MTKPHLPLRSVRVVLTAWYSVVLLIGFVLFAGSTYYYLQSLLLSGLDKDLTEETDWILHFATKHDSPADTTARQQLPEALQDIVDDHFGGNPRNYVVMLAANNGTMLYESENWADLSPPYASMHFKRRFFFSKSSPKGNVRVCVGREGPFLAQIAYPERPVEQALDHLLSIFSILVPVVLLFSVSGGWLFSKLAFRPIDQITEMANRITASNLAERIPARRVPDEIGRLITTLNHMIERLQHSFNQIREFSLNVSHELRTPLTILRGESELALTKQLTPEDARQLANTYLEETVRLSRIVDDLLTLTKADAGQMRIQHENVPFAELIDELYENTQLLAASKRLTVLLVHNDPVTIKGDPARLQQLLRNLMMNAIQYTPAGGSIRIGSRRTGNSVEAYVQDTGIGIAPEELAHIFRPFYRADNARARTTGGSGLGLSISQWIAQAHGGVLHAASTFGQGSTFTVILPFSPSAA